MIKVFKKKTFRLEINAMNNRTFLTFLAFIILGGFVSSQDGAGREDKKNLDECIYEVRELEADINILNLVNGLHLTDNQIKVILREAISLQKEIGDLHIGKKEILNQKNEELKLLKSVRDSLKKTGKVSSSMKTKLEQLAVKRIRKENAWKMNPNKVKRVEQSSERVLGKLSLAQQNVISNYKACLIPPKDLKNPVRVGQAANTSRFERFLLIMRRLPDFAFANHASEIINKSVSEAEKQSGAMDPEERSAYINKVYDQIENARGMSDVEFELNKSAMAQAIQPPDRIKEMGDNLGDMGVKKFQLSGRISQFLLTPRIIPILETRSKMQKDGLKAVKADKR